jgi:hypothetical protein
MLIQQGDVLVKSIQSIPSNLKPLKKDGRGYVFAEGEVTGHYHGVDCVDADVDMLIDEVTKKIYMQNSSEVVVTHQEHGHVTIPAGTWEVGRVQEYDHFAEEARAVQD